MEDGDLDRRPTLDRLVKLIFEELDPHLNGEIWRDFESPLHDTFIGFLWEYYHIFGNPLIDG
jgi:hypothetical protein